MEPNAHPKVAAGGRAGTASPDGAPATGAPATGATGAPATGATGAPAMGATSAPATGATGALDYFGKLSADCLKMVVQAAGQFETWRAVGLVCRRFANTVAATPMIRAVVTSPVDERRALTQHRSLEAVEFANGHADAGWLAMCHHLRNVMFQRPAAHAFDDYQVWHRTIPSGAVATTWAPANPDEYKASPPVRLPRLEKMPAIRRLIIGDAEIARRLGAAITAACQLKVLGLWAKTGDQWEWMVFLRLADLGASKATAEQLAALYATQAATLELLRLDSPDKDGLCDIGALDHLRTLELVGVSREDLAALAGMPKLCSLGIPRCAGLVKAGSLRVLSTCPRLRSLDVSGTQLQGLEGLAGMALERLDAGETAVRDVRPLAKMPLRWLRLAGCPVGDWAPLAAIRTLRYLDVTGCPGAPGAVAAALGPSAAVKIVA
jgi:hypothetical protein